VSRGETQVCPIYKTEKAANPVDELGWEPFERAEIDGCSSVIRHDVVDSCCCVVCRVNVRGNCRVLIVIEVRCRNLVSG